MEYWHRRSDPLSCIPFLYIFFLWKLTSPTCYIDVYLFCRSDPIHQHSIASFLLFSSHDRSLPCDIYTINEDQLTSIICIHVNKSTWWLTRICFTNELVPLHTRDRSYLRKNESMNFGCIIAVYFYLYKPACYTNGLWVNTAVESVAVHRPAGSECTSRSETNGESWAMKQ